MKKKRVLLLAVSCKKGGLCPGGIDLDHPREWIRVVKDDGRAGAVQGRDIDFAEPLDIIEFEGSHMPQGKQRENWVIENHSCKKVGRISKERLPMICDNYGYHGFWDNHKEYLNEEEFAASTQPSESILKVTDVRIYRNDRDKAKIDFSWSGSRYKIRRISMTDQEFYDKILDAEVCFKEAYIIISIPKEVGDWIHPGTGEKRAYKFVSKIFEL